MIMIQEPSARNEKLAMISQQSLERETHLKSDQLVPISSFKAGSFYLSEIHFLHNAQIVFLSFQCLSDF